MRRELVRSALRVMITGTLAIAVVPFHHSAFAAPANGNWDGENGETGPPPQGADGVSFLPVPLDTNVNCNSVILKGTRRFQGTAFVLPRVVIAQNKQKETQFEIIQLDSDQYLMRFAVYFPRTDDELHLHMRGQNVRLQGCDFTAVLANLNRNVKEENAQVRTLSRIPISGVDVRIDGVREAYKLGAVDGSILHYQGLDHVVEFPMNRKQLDATLARIEGNIGLGIHVAIKFNARSGDGALYIDANLNELAAGLEAALRGKKVIAAAQLASLIESQLTKMNLNIESEHGNSRVFQNAAEQIMDMIMDGLSGRDDGWDGGWGSSRSGRWNDDDDDWGNGNSPFNLGLTSGTGNSLGTDPDFGTVGDEKAAIQVDLMLKLLRKKKNFKVNYTNMGPSAQQVYSTSVLFRGEIADPDVRVLNVAGGIDNARILPNRLTKGKGLTLAIAGRIPEKIDYVLKKRYLSSKEVKEMNLAGTFPLLRDQRAILRDKATYMGSVGALRAKGFLSSDYYVWGMIEAKSKTQRGRLEEGELTMKAFENAPLLVRFSKIGPKKIAISELLKENDYWKGEWDDMGGKIIFKAKKDLGQMQIINTEEDQMVTVKRQSLFQERRGGRSNKLLAVSNTQPQLVKVPSFRSTYQLQLSHDAEEGDVVATVNPESSGNPQSSVLVPGTNPSTP